jgi:hypothetical protein
MSSTLAVTPGMIDLIIGMVVVEFAVLGVVLLRQRAGRLTIPLLLYLTSGASLLLALRAALTDPGQPWVGVALLASLIAHVASLWRSYPLVQLVRPAVASPGVPTTGESVAGRPA